MSRGYQIRLAPLTVAKSLATASDELCVQISLLPVLGDDRMRELLREALAADGWKQTADGGLATEIKPGLTATLAKDGKTVTVTMTSHVEVTGSARDVAEAERLAKANAERAQTAVKRTATTTLAAAEGDVRAAVDAVIQRVYVTALEEKARSMGNLESMERSVAADGTVEIVLKIRT